MRRKSIIDIIKKGRNGWKFKFEILLKCLFNQLPCFLPLLRLIGSILILLINQQLKQPFNRIINLNPMFLLFLLTVQCRVIRGGVVPNPIGHILNKIGFPMFQNILPSMSRGHQTGQRIIAVDPSAGNTDTDGPGDDAVGGVLVRDVGRDCVLVVSAQEERLAPKRGCEVQRTGEITLAGCPLSDKTGRHLILVGGAVYVASACGLRGLGA